LDRRPGESHSRAGHGGENKKDPVPAWNYVNNNALLILLSNNSAYGGHYVWFVKS
jgi:hypothetical protein